MSSSSDDETTTLRDRLVSTFPLFDSDTSFVPWVEAHQSELDALDVDVDAVQRSLQIAHAEGQSLDLIGADFGRFGLRRGRDDDEYRAYLQSLVPAFDGRGTNRDVRVAIAAGLAIDPEDDVALREDFEANAYEVELHDWTPHQSGTVREMAELADPVAIPRREPVHYISETTTLEVLFGETTSAVMFESPPVAVEFLASATSIAEMYEAPTARVEASASPSTSDVVAIGLSSPYLGPLSSDGWVLSIREAPAANVAVVASSTLVATMAVLSTASPRVAASPASTRPMTTLPAFAPRLAPGDAIVAPMTETPTAAVDVSPRLTDATTLATRGLSSARLGGVSTTEMDQLA